MKQSQGGLAIKLVWETKFDAAGRFPTACSRGTNGANVLTRHEQQTDLRTIVEVQFRDFELPPDDFRSKEEFSALQKIRFS